MTHRTDVCMHKLCCEILFVFLLFILYSFVTYGDERTNEPVRVGYYENEVFQEGAREL